MVLIRRTKSHRRSSRRSWDASKICLILVAMTMIVAMGLARYQFSLDGLGVSRVAARIGRKDQQVFFDQKLHDANAPNKDYWEHPSLNLENPRLAESSDFYDTIASEIIHALDCHTLLSSHKRIEINSQYVYGIPPSSKANQKGPTLDLADPAGDTVIRDPEPSRRLRVGDRDTAGAGDSEHVSDVVRIGEARNSEYDDDGIGRTLLTGAHLFCLAAFPAVPLGTPEDKDDTVFWKDQLHCPVRSSVDDSDGAKRRRTQESLLDLWSTARAEIPDEHVLQQTLRFATEQSITLVGTSVHVWTAPGDTGLIYTTKILNDQVTGAQRLTSLYNGIAGLNDTLGPGKLYVDVGSGLGLTAMAVAILYPGTEIVSIEAASTNWLLQEMNWRCNDFDTDHDTDRHEVHLAGVGISAGSTSQSAKFLWRPTATTSTRAWGLSLAEEAQDLKEIGLDDLEVAVKLRSWHSIEAEANIKGRPIDVLNLDCEGCEYNLIPALSVEDFDAIRVILGQVHWGDIPTMKLPSSKRGSETHERLCRHEAFARFSIECCAFPDVKVQSSFSGEVLVADTNQFPPIQSTVKDVAGSLCDGFPEWAKNNNLNNVESDWAWMQGSSMRQKR